jgi:hypothetical protein
MHFHAALYPVYCPFSRNRNRCRLSAAIAQSISEARICRGTPLGHYEQTIPPSPVVAPRPPGWYQDFTTNLEPLFIKFTMDLWKLLLSFLALVIIPLIVGYYRLATALSKTDQLLPLWEYIAELPILGLFVGRIFTMLIKVINPYSRSIGFPPNSTMRVYSSDFRITSLEVGRCSGRLERRRTSDGPFRCTHGVALTLFAETLAGLAVFSRLLKGGKGILIKSETEYVKKAKGIQRN